MSDSSTPEATQSDSAATIAVDPAETHQEPQKPAEGLSGTRIAVFAVVGVVLSVALAIVVQFFAIPAFINHQKGNEMSDLIAQRGSITVANTNMVTFAGTKIKNVNVNQKALSTAPGGEAAKGFIFTNGKPSQSRKNVEVFVDFSSQRSRDFLILNAKNLRTMVENGVIQLDVIPLPTGNVFNLYAAEAISESAATSPEKAWDLTIELLRLSASVNTNKAADIVKMVAETAKTQGINSVDEASIKNGTFTSWLVSLSNDSRLKVGFYPPLVYVDNKLIDSEKVNLNDGDELRNAILGRS